MIGPLGKLGAAATLGQHCPQMAQRRCTLPEGEMGIRHKMNKMKTTKKIVIDWALDAEEPEER